MHAVVDCRPTAELSDIEVVAYLVREIRNRNLKAGAQVSAACDLLFPDMPHERKLSCIEQLANRLSTVS